MAAEMHVQLAAAKVRHGLIEGDNLDMAYPAPWRHHLAERNLAAMWANYRELGYRRLIYTNTASVLGHVSAELKAAIGGDPRITPVLLTCEDTTARQRLAQREIGAALDWHIQRSEKMARQLDRRAPVTVHRVATDNRTTGDIATEIISLAAWLPG